MIAPNPDYRAADDDLSFENTENRHFAANSRQASEDPLAAYFAQIGSFPLLSREQEVDIAARWRTTAADFASCCWTSTS